jgi:hypothetical protein
VTVDREALDRDIDRLRQALAGLPADHPGRADLHADLGAALRQRYDLTGDLTDLDAAITHLSEAVAATPADHPDRSQRLIRLGDALLARFERTRKRADREAGMARLREGGMPEEELRQRIRQADARAIGDDFWDGIELARGGPPLRDEPPTDARVGDSDYVWDGIERSLPPPRDEPPPMAEVPPPPMPPAPPAPMPPAPPAPMPAVPPPTRPGPAQPPPPPGGRGFPSGPAAPRGPVPTGPGVPGGPASPDEPPTGGVAYGAPQPVTVEPPPTLDRRRKRAPEPEPAADDRRLEFAAAYRRRIEATRRYPLLFYVHRPHAREMVRSLINRRAPQLGGAPEVSQAAAARTVESGTTITVVPNVLGATFEPSRIDVVVDDAVRELTFHMTVPADTPPGPLGGYIDIFVGPLIIGQVPVEFEVHWPGPVGVPAPSEGEQFLTVANASIFDKVFISYSRRDSKIVDLCIATYQGLGVQILVDRLELRSGDDWRARLENMIRESDIFQLYWSSNAAASAEVSHEWRLALALSKTRDRFIRPLYWEKPMPTPPEALNHLHFSHLDLKLLRRAVKAHRPGKPGLLGRVLAAVRGTPA